MYSVCHQVYRMWEKKRKTAIEVAVWSGVLHIVTPSNRIEKLAGGGGGIYTYKYKYRYK